MSISSTKFWYLDNHFSVSTSVGSGKTYAAVQYMLGGSLCTQDFLYVAPTIALVEQTAKDLKTHLQNYQGHARNVNLIHSEADSHLSSFEAALKCINDTQGNMGTVVIITTATFLRVLPMMRGKRYWRVLLDEAFKPLDFLYYKLGADQEAGRQHFFELFSVDSRDGLVTPAEGKAELVRAIARKDYDTAGTRYEGRIQAFAAAVANDAMRCELVKGQSNWLTLATYVTPDYLAGFDEVVFMAALFEHSILFHLWRGLFQVNFKTHPFFSVEVKRNVHESQGQYVSIGHLLHPKDNASRYNLERNRETGRGAEKTYGKRIIDQLVETSCEFFGGSEFLLQVNNWTGYEKRRDVLPTGAKLIKVHSHGLNGYQGYTKVASLAVTNPDRWEAAWIMERTGLSADEMYLAYRVHTVYQAVGRTAIRRAGDTQAKVFLTAGCEDARFLHQLFKGSTWLGQVGGLESVAALARRHKRPNLQDHPRYRRLRNRRDALRRKARAGTIRPAERQELETVLEDLRTIKRVA